MIGVAVVGQHVELHRSARSGERRVVLDHRRRVRRAHGEREDDVRRHVIGWVERVVVADAGGEQRHRARIAEREIDIRIEREGGAGGRAHVSIDRGIGRRARAAGADDLEQAPVTVTGSLKTTTTLVLGATLAAPDGHGRDHRRRGIPGRGAVPG